MSKYNISEKRKKTDVNYVANLSKETVEKIYEQIMLKFVVEKKYRNAGYTAAQMAKEIGYNSRYISAVVRMRYHDNFSQLINNFRIKEAMYMMTDKHFVKMNIEEIATATGFANRQCFYAAFYRMAGMTPREYRLQHTVK